MTPVSIAASPLNHTSYGALLAETGNDKVPFTVLLDANGQIAKQYGTTKFPETFMVIDGRVRSFIMGPRDWDSWFARAYVESFFEGR